MVQRADTLETKKYLAGKIVLVEAKFDFVKLYKKYPTPSLVQKYLKSIPYNNEKSGDTMRSAYQAIKNNKIHCLEASFVAAAILEHGGYPPLVLSLESQDYLDHVVYVYLENSKWGGISRSKDSGLQGRKPIFKSLKDLAASYIDPYIDGTGRITGYAVANLNNCGADWRHSKRNVWKAEQYLIAIKHSKINCSQVHYQKLLDRFNKGLKPIPHKSWR